MLKAGNAAVAMELREREGDGIDLALLDITMPGVSGVDLARGLRQRRPDLPVVFWTGQPTQGLGAEFLGHPSIAFTQKPYNSAEIQRAMQRVVRRIVERP